jgi:ABC-type polysaccharide/polyol phosphate transport system ATPase subunit
MPETVKLGNPEPILRIVDVCKAFRYHGGASSLEDEDEGDDEEIEDEDVEKLKPGETRLALRNINLSIFPGERLGIIGANGAGKSTLLNIVSGMSHPTSGSIIGRGSLVPLDKVSRPFNPKWDGLSNLRVLARLLGFPAELIDERRAEIACFADLEHAISQPVKTYSRGMYARLAFAAALELDGDIYTSDDVLGVGDQAYQIKCFDRLVKLCESGKTLVFATHKMKSIEQICTRVVWLDNGQVRADDESSSVITSYLARPSADQAETVEHDEGTPRGWFKQKYRCNYPLPSPLVQQTRVIFDPEKGELESGLPLSGIVSLELNSTKTGLYGLIENNEMFSIRVRLGIATQNVIVDMMLRISTRNLLIYQSFLPRSLHIRGPQEFVFDIGIDSSRLPDNVYRIQLHVLFTNPEKKGRFTAKGNLFVATKDCGPSALPREKSFAVEEAPEGCPLGDIELDWRVIGLEEPLLVVAKN